jgi:hypothetical protein
MSQDHYIPSGQLQGDTGAMPDRGTSVGMAGDSYGADLSQDAIDRAGSITGSSKSDPMEETEPAATAGSDNGDAAEDAKEGN